MNTFTATGRLANDAHLSNASGTSVSNFRLASEAGYGKHQKTLWIDCSLWGPKADALHQYLLKGKLVLISGELTTKEYKRKDGSLGTGFSLTVDRIEFIGAKRHNEDFSQDKNSFKPRKSFSNNANMTAPSSSFEESNSNKSGRLAEDSISNR
ncbi:MAG: single-stranded DNA-binding protein [Oligoflexales bacterium]|nr:single-stranded DNA-binding protein [Oligoflexales bacterium]